MSDFVVVVWTAIKRALCYVKKYCCTWRKLFIIISASYSFSPTICLRVGLHYRLLMCVYAFVDWGLSQAQGFAGDEGPVGVDVHVLVTPRGQGVCVSGCVTGKM